MSSLFEGTSVIELNSKGFSKNGNKSVLKKMGPGIIMFYAAYCPYCQMKRDTYIELAKRLNGNGFKIYSVNIKDPKSKEITMSQGVSTIPAFYKVLDDGSLELWNENYSPEAIMKLANDQKGGACGKKKKNTKKVVNPLTGRKIQVGGARYNELSRYGLI